MNTPSVAVFTRDNPCSKFELWKCFRGRRGWVQPNVPAAQAIIGKNAPRVMESKGYLERISTGSQDIYKLTPEGEKWLFDGFYAYLKRHPLRVKDAQYVPSNWDV